MPQMPERVTVRVPATSANLGPGFDCLGLALDLYSTFTVALRPGGEELAITIDSPWGDDAAIRQLPADASNLMYQSLAARLNEHGIAPPPLEIHCAIAYPPGRGLGSSASAVIAGILVADALAGRSCPPDERASLLDAAVALERGHHADNVAAALLGGLVAVARDERAGMWRALHVAVPRDLRAVVFMPAFPMETVAGRNLLPASYARADATHNVGHVALLLAALAAGDLGALAAAMDDRLHEPYRAQMFPQMTGLMEAARAAGACGACLSGGGSAILALATENAADVADALAATARALSIEGRTLILEIAHQGATVALDASAPPSIVLLCPSCGARADLRRTDYRCQCGTPLDVDLAGAGSDRDGQSWRRIFDDRLRSRKALDRSGVWRFREILLPLPGIAPVARPEGSTNLYPVGREQHAGGHGRIGAFAGLDRLWLKHEGENPTGSFKDRGMTVGVTMARWLGATAVACASTGNTSASLAAYAAQAGLPAIVLLPQGKVAAGKLAQAIAYGAEIREVTGDFDRAMRDVERLCREEGVYLLNSLNPFRILGQQSLAFEICQQLDWSPPDWIVLPAGNLGNTSALGMGLLRARQLGLIERVPRIAAIQASGANPFYRSFLEGFAALQPVEAHTIATAINIGAPVSFARARAIIAATSGVVAQVSDEEILRAKAIVDRAGIGCEPASAAALAGTRKLVAEGAIAPGASVVAVLTGNLLKDPDAILPAQQAIEREEGA
jgi:threonine synthase